MKNTMISDSTSGADPIYGEPRGTVPDSGPSITAFFSDTACELIYVEQCVPAAGDRTHIYWSGCNFVFGKRIGYAGLQHKSDKVFTYNNICSIWDLAETTPDQPAEVRLDFSQSGLHSAKFAGEGTGLHTSHPMPWVPGQRYATAIRRWYRRGEDVTRMAMFMYAFSDDRWTHYMSASIPGANLFLSGDRITGFLERFSGDAFGYHGHFGPYFRLDDQFRWQKPAYYLAQAGGLPSSWNAELAEDDTSIKLIAGGVFRNADATIRLEPRQPDDKPTTAVPPVVERVQIAYDKLGTLYVEWSPSANTPPMLGHFIEVCRAGDDDNVFARDSDMTPQRRSTRFWAGILLPGEYSVWFYFIDIFNQYSNRARVDFSVP